MPCPPLPSPGLGNLSRLAKPASLLSFCPPVLLLAMAPRCPDLPAFAVVAEGPASLAPIPASRGALTFPASPRPRSSCSPPPPAPSAWLRPPFFKPQRKRPLYQYSFSEPQDWIRGTPPSLLIYLLMVSASPGSENKRIQLPSRPRDPEPESLLGSGGCGDREVSSTHLDGLHPGRASILSSAPALPRKLLPVESSTQGQRARRPYPSPIPGVSPEVSAALDVSHPSASPRSRWSPRMYSAPFSTWGRGGVEESRGSSRSQGSSPDLFLWRRDPMRRAAHSGSSPSPWATAEITG